MAPLPFASLPDIYNYHNDNQKSNLINNSTNNITQNQLDYNNKFVKENQNYQSQLQHNQTSGNPNFKDVDNSSPKLDIAGTNKTEDKKYIPPNVPLLSENNSKFANRPAWTNIHNSSFKGLNMFNRFQKPFQNSIDYLSDHDQLVSLLQEICFILKSIMIILILLLVAKLCDKK